MKTITETAAEIGIPQSTLSNILNGKRRCSVQTAKKIVTWIADSCSFRIHWSTIYDMSPEKFRRTLNLVFEKSQDAEQKKLDNIYSL